MSAHIISWLPLGVAKRIFQRWGKAKPRVVMHGIRVVWGIPDRMLPVFGAMPGRWRFKFRNNQFGKLYSRAGSETRAYYLEIRDGKWIARIEGVNKKGER